MIITHTLGEDTIWFMVRIHFRGLGRAPLCAFCYFLVFTFLEAKLIFGRSTTQRDKFREKEERIKSRKEPSCQERRDRYET